MALRQKLSAQVYIIQLSAGLISFVDINLLMRKFLFTFILLDTNSKSFPINKSMLFPLLAKILLVASPKNIILKTTFLLGDQIIR